MISLIKQRSARVTTAKEWKGLTVAMRWQGSIGTKFACKPVAVAMKYTRAHLAMAE